MEYIDHCKWHYNVDIREDVGRRAKRDLFMEIVSRKHLITKREMLK